MVLGTFRGAKKGTRMGSTISAGTIGAYYVYFPEKVGVFPEYHF